MRTPHVARCHLILALALGLALLTAACSGSKPDSASAKSAPNFGTPTQASPLAQAAVVECAIHRRLISASVLDSQHNYAQWYTGSRVTINGPFGRWWSLDQAAVIKGQTLRQWAETTAGQKKLPVQLCGSTAIPTPSPTST